MPSATPSRNWRASHDAVLRDKVIFDNGRATTIQVMERPELPPLKTFTLTVQTDGAGTIVSVERDGASAACAPMARKVAG